MLNNSTLKHTQEVVIQRTPGVCGGNARVRNTRIPVWTLVAFRQEGMTDEELLYNYPSLTPSDLEATWAYYQAHPSEIDQAMADQDED
jgi:type III restriction enzyme